jgi:hypothetical protein
MPGKSWQMFKKNGNQYTFYIAFPAQPAHQCWYRLDGHNKGVKVVDLR